MAESDSSSLSAGDDPIDTDRRRRDRRLAGRREVDSLPRTTLTKLWVLIVVGIINLISLGGDAIIYLTINVGK
ncbi:TPA_asm: hypothetical protein [ssRNA phage Zoerhiza.4_2]|uniref:Uncharacterized protein n=1 Tax=ssRNA phage Zoerhiza.4_2 TaxID=2786836 RepID=A0A8S5KYE0_9VIRU|nr:hypothetical protein QIO71_gp3 [ssRNA phage Zoerhiza.4_2]DAD50320.1 TPA_asm: hypothetical protein [ssRNA phage Zoerhiza.4_2]